MLSNWMPYKLLQEGQHNSILWMNMEDRFMEEPFFDETILNNRIHAKNKGRRLLSQSDIISLCDWASMLEYYPVTAFIFHVSRCGSTLLSQCLAADKRYNVVAEAPLLDEVLQMDATILPKGITREHLFKAVLAFLGQKRLGQQQLFVKLDSWHLHQYALLRSWFPETPFYFLSREPKAIIRSHRKRRGIHMIPGYLPEKANPVPVEERHHRDFSSFIADVLSSFYRALIAIREQDNPRDRFYDYAWGMEGMLRDFEDHTGAVLGSELVQARLAKHSKYPDQVFAEVQQDGEEDKYTDCLKVYQHYNRGLWSSAKV